MLMGKTTWRLSIKPGIPCLSFRHHIDHCTIDTERLPNTARERILVNNDPGPDIEQSHEVLYSTYATQKAYKAFGLRGIVSLFNSIHELAVRP